MEQQPRVALAGRMLALQHECQRRRDEVDHQERQEERQQLVKAGGAGRLRMEVPVDEVVDDSGDEHQVDQRRDQRQQYLENQDVGQREQAHGAALADGGLVLEDRLQDAE